MEQFQKNDVLIITNDNRFILRRKNNLDDTFIQMELDLDISKIDTIIKNAKSKGIRVENGFDPNNSMEQNEMIYENHQNPFKHSDDSEDSFSDCSDNSDAGLVDDLNQELINKYEDHNNY